MDHGQSGADTSSQEERRNRFNALRQTITEGAQVSHRAVEIVATQDAARPLHEPELHVVARGIEVLAKATWILNERLITGRFRPARTFGHHLLKLLEAIDEQAEKRSLPGVLDDPLMLIIASAAEDFADGGRFRPLDGLASGKRYFPPYLAWNGVQMASTKRFSAFSEQAKRSAYLRAAHTATLQRLERSFATHLLVAQQELWGNVIVERRWLQMTAKRLDDDLSEPIPLEMAHRRCACADLDRSISIWAPVEK